MIEITFLGNAASLPTKERNLFSIHLKYLNNRMLFDCGEGTQRQLLTAGISPYRLQNIFITHLHADHILGLGGLLQTLNFLGREEGLMIFGPRKTKKIVDFFKNWDYFECGFPIKTKEIWKDGLVFENKDFSITAFKVDHHCPTYGYVFEEKVEVNLDQRKIRKLGLERNPLCRKLKKEGKIRWKGKIVKLEDVAKPLRRKRKIVLAVDSKPCKSIVKYAKNADLLICEATHTEDLREKSHMYFHMTAKDAARIAKKADVGKLALTHFSARYEDEKVLEKEAKTIFKNTIAVKDLMSVEI